MGELVSVDNEKKLIIEYSKLKKERDALVVGVDFSALQGGGMNMMALAPLMSKVDDITRIYELTKAMEGVANSLIEVRIGALS